MPKENKEMALLLEFQCENTTSEGSMDSPILLSQRRPAVVTAEKGACVTVAMYGSTRKAQDWPRVCLKGQIGRLRFYR